MNDFKKILFLSSILFVSVHLQAQKKTPTNDSTAYYDELFNELDHFLDSLMAPRNMLIGSFPEHVHSKPIATTYFQL